MEFRLVVCSDQLKQRTAKQKGKASGPFKSEVSNELRRYRSQYKQTTPVINELSEALSDFGRELSFPRLAHHS